MIELMIEKTNQYDILIVDDSHDSLELLNRILEERGYRVRMATNGRLALKSVAAKLPDLILMDVKMPEMDGYEVCRRLKADQHSQNVPVIFISVFGETTKKIEGFIAGGVDFITKPFDREEVFARVEIHLSLHELTERLEQQVDQRTQQLQQEIAERIFAEEKLRESEEKYRTMMEAFVEPLCICSHDFIIEYMNPAMIRRIGRDATWERCYNALHGLDSKCDWCVFDKAMKGDKVETTIRSPLDDRQYRILNMPIENKDGTISKMSIYRDITDYLAAVSEKEKTKAQLLQAQKMESIGNLAGGIAHDFNNILSSVIGFTELALDDVQKGTPPEDCLQEIYSASKRARDLVKQILAFARQSDEKTGPIQPSKIMKEVLNFIRSTIPTTIEIQQAIESDSLIMGNPTQVHQMMMNLLTNAAFAMEENGGVLTVSLKDTVIEKRFGERDIGLKDGHYVALSVSDTGTGIPPEIIDSIFDPYFTTKGPGQGTGMGLAMVHGIVESYSGKITVKSTYDKGTTIIIYLPITQKRKTQRSYENKQLPTGAERILFVDDEAPIAKMGARNLAGLGYSVTSRTSSLEALELFRAKPNKIDLVITDMTMPNMTGDKLAVELLKIRPDIPIILCTGYSKKISDETASEIGIKAIAYKPIVKADLAKMVRKVLDETKG